jgi:hypothetical protein
MCLELDALKPEREHVRQLEELRLDVGTGAPRLADEPGAADLESAVLWTDLVVVRRSGEAAVVG